MNATSFEIIEPDDWHLHLRDGDVLNAVVHDTSSNFGRAIIMPNLVPPVITTKDAQAYKARILDALGEGHHFDPLMTLYLTQQTKADDVKAGALSGLISAVKLYPAGATTNSASGVHDISKVMNVLETMAQIGLPLLVHGEVTDPNVDIFDREAVFIETVLEPLRQKLPQLRIVMEHVTTSQGVDYVRAQPENLAATITTHHLIINRNTILVGGIKPHYYCLPIAKRESHRLALLEAATSGDERFFLGTDSAPHLDGAKESACGCAGIYSAPNTMACLAHVFENEGKLENLERFTSRNGPDFYKLPYNERRIRMVKQSTPIAFPEKIAVHNQQITLFDPGFPLHWNVEKL